MSNDDIGGIFSSLAFLAFMPVFVTYTVHARPLACRSALTLFLGLLVAGVFFRHGPVAGTLITFGILLMPVPMGVVAAVTASGLKHSIEKKYGPTGVSYSIIGTVRDMYRTVWAVDH